MPPNIVIVGASLAGASAAATLREEGFDGDVMLIGAESQFPYERPALSKQYLRGEPAFEKMLVRPAAFYEQNRVETLLGVRVTRVGPGDRTVELQTGRHIHYYKLLLATGVRNRRPEIPGLNLPGVLALRSVTDGDALRELVDEHCRSTIDDIYAAGDIANHYHPLLRRRMRVEHWQNAMQQGAAAARSMLGKRHSYVPIHWFWSDQYDVNLQYAGLHQQEDRLVIRGSLDSRSFLAFYVGDHRVNAVVALNRGKDLRRAMPLIKERAVVDSADLEDESVDLRSLLHAHIGGNQGGATT